VAFDGNFTGFIVKELNSAIDARIDKIYQPSTGEIYLTLRKKGFVKKVVLSIKNGMSRVHFTETKPENPEKPPMFCMLMRKHFSSAKLIGVTQKGFERLIEFSFEATNEMGDKVNLRIICELIGNLSNIVMVDEQGKIIDALRRSDIAENKRMVLPGVVYTYPETQDKYNILTSDIDEIYEGVKRKGELPIWKAILDTVGGTSPLTAREIVYKSGLPDFPVSEISDLENLKSGLNNFKNSLKGKGSPFILIDKGNPKDFSFSDISQYGNLYEKKEFNSFGEMLDCFYETREKESVRKRITGEVDRLVQNLISRANKRLFARVTQLKECEERENLRIYGELIKANIGLIKSGQERVKLPNYYDENLSEIEIKLDPSLNASANAAKYFKEYKKKSTAATTLIDFIEDDKKEIAYLETVSDSLSRCETLNDLREIKSELAVSGYIKQSPKDKNRKQTIGIFKEYKSSEGYRIIVGKNNMQNDYLTTKLASKKDLWFHTKNIHGSHVIVFCDGKEVGEETIIFASKLAAKNSKAANSSNVPVDYTEIKNVKKPAGAKPGMVIYTANKTVFVTPDIN